MRSQNGFQAIESASSHMLRRFDVPGHDVILPLRDGSCGFLLVHLAMRLDRLEPIDGKVPDDWGWAFRNVRGSTVVMSNHASGTAMDYNATKHPLGKVGTWAKPFRVRWMLRRYRGCIRWGGDYEKRKDEMHFEIDASIKECEDVAKRLMGFKRGRRILACNPGLRARIMS